MSLFNRKMGQTESDLSGDFSDTPNPSFLSKWFGGIVVTVCVLIYGLRCCILQKAVIFGRGGVNLEISGIPAVFMGLAWLSAAFFIHFHYFWPTIKRLCVYADLAKTIALLCLISTFGYVVWTIIM